MDWEREDYGRAETDGVCGRVSASAVGFVGSGGVQETLRKHQGLPAAGEGRGAQTPDSITSAGTQLSCIPVGARPPRR